MGGERRAIVTGGSSGIGHAAVTRLLDEGWKVAVLDRSVGESCRGRSRHVVADVTSSALATAVDEAVDWLGGLEAAVNAAGVGAAPMPLVDYDLTTWAGVLDVNLTGVLRSMQAQSAHLAAGGSIVNVSSVLGHAVRPGAGAYVASKHALEAITRVAALELADRGIRVNTVVPGFIDTPLLRATRDEEERRAIASTHPVGRLGRAEEVAAAIAFLVAEDSTFTTGTALRVDGGFLA